MPDKLLNVCPADSFSDNTTVISGRGTAYHKKTSRYYFFKNRKYQEKISQFNYTGDFNNNSFIKVLVIKTENHCTC